MAGWIQLQRALMDWEWYKKPNHAHVFVYLLLKANHQDSRWQGMDIKRGEHITSLKGIASGTGLTIQIVRTILKNLKKSGEINTITNTKLTHISICKYDTYQNTQTPPNTELTQNQHRANTELTTNNNDNNKKKDNKKNKYIEDIKTVLSHLNANAKTKYRVANDLPARFNEGYTVDDALKVIDNKLSWLGTDQQKFLRPETLFCKKHFDSYLNELPHISSKLEKSHSQQLADQGIKIFN